jgi:hypothetical protein
MRSTMPEAIGSPRSKLALAVKSGVFWITRWSATSLPKASIKVLNFASR